MTILQKIFLELGTPNIYALIFQRCWNQIQMCPRLKIKPALFPNLVSLKKNHFKWLVSVQEQQEV